MGVLIGGLLGAGLTGALAGVLGIGSAFAQAAAQVAVKAPGAAVSSARSSAASSPAYVPMTPTPGIGMPVDGGIGMQRQFSPTGQYAEWIHNAVLLPVLVAICLLVLILLGIVAARFNTRANPTASRTSHNTTLEVLWTLAPVFILLGIAVPSFDLIAKQYKSAPANALTIKVTGNQWFWSYSYPDNGNFEVISNMLNVPGQPVINAGVRTVGSKPWDGPSHLEVDNRMVVPAGEPIRLLITATDVIHSFAVPSLWFKLDAVPGRINERVLYVERPGVYYGQCSELCGAKHGFMPIAVEALPRGRYNAWVLTHAGAKVDTRRPGSGQPSALALVAAPAAPVTPQTHAD